MPRVSVLGHTDLEPSLTSQPAAGLCRRKCLKAQASTAARDRRTSSSSSPSPAARATSWGIQAPYSSMKLCSVTSPASGGSGKRTGCCCASGGSGKRTGCCCCCCAREAGWRGEEAMRGSGTHAGQGDTPTTGQGDSINRAQQYFAANNLTTNTLTATCVCSCSHPLTTVAVAALVLQARRHIQLVQAGRVGGRWRRAGWRRPAAVQRREQCRGGSKVRWSPTGGEDAVRVPVLRQLPSQRWLCTPTPRVAGLWHPQQAGTGAAAWFTGQLAVLTWEAGWEEEGAGCSSTQWDCKRSLERAGTRPRAAAP